MPLPSTALKITFGGQLPGNEVWQCGLWYVPIVVPASQAALQTLANQFVTPITAWFNSAGIQSLEASGMTLGNLSVYVYPAGATKSSMVAHATVSVASVITVASKPNQCAIVASLRSSSPARNARGRIYIPVLSGGNLSGNNLTAGVTTAVSTATASLITALNATPTASSGVVVAGTSGFTAINVVVDSVVDTQRRRRNKTAATSTVTTAV